MQQKLLITGASGMVGSAMLEYALSSTNFEVHAISRNALQFSNAKVHFEAIDILDASALNSYIKNLQPNCIINLASQSSVGVSWQMPQYTINTNVGILTNLLEAVRLHSLESKILHIGSAEVYGQKNVHELCAETDALKPNNAYGLSRVLQEKIIAYYTQIYNLHIISTRSFNHLSKLQIDKFFVPSILNQIVQAKKSGLNVCQLQVGNLNVYRDFLHVQDVLSMYFALLEKGTPGEIYNVCSGKPILLQTIIDTFAQIADIKVEALVNPSLVRAQDNPYLVGNNNKVLQTIVWQPNYTLESTLQEMYNYKLKL